jgi:uncharacterized protein (DUF433 family)
MNEQIVADPKICGGEPCIKGTRIPVKVVLSHLAAGESHTDITANFPSLTEADIRACLEFASYLATERVA